MAEFPFTLQGTQRTYNGNGRRNGETYESPEFELKPGLVIAEMEHHGSGEFRLEFVPTEGLSKRQATAASLGGSFAAGAATGAAIGSVVPVAGTILGGLIGGAAGWLAGEAIDDAVAPIIWTAIEHKGEIGICRLMQVNEDTEGCLNPGKYRLEVKSKSRWTCRFIQPNLGQSTGPFTDDEDGNTDDESTEFYFIPFLSEEEWDEHPANRATDGLAPPGIFIIGPYKSGRRPLLAQIQHDGGDTFNVEAFSIDGTHYCEVFRQDGQFYVEDHPTEVRPGKEYVLYVYADGAWMLDFTEGY